MARWSIPSRKPWGNEETRLQFYQNLLRLAIFLPVFVTFIRLRLRLRRLYLKCKCLHAHRNHNKYRVFEKHPILYRGFITLRVVEGCFYLQQNFLLFFAFPIFYSLIHITVVLTSSLFMHYFTHIYHSLVGSISFSHLHHFVRMMTAQK